ncbi:MAG: hypothetical protein JOY61_15980, partial [Chloroflexi bacterium]|nr:hypothetical protein [Chloroflexota bacterium]
LVLHAFLAALFTYLFARKAFGVHPLAAVIGGLAYAFGGFAVGQVGHLNQISAAAWLPAVLLAYDHFRVRRQMRFLAFGALAIAMQLLAGHPQETYMSLIVLGLYGVVTAPWRRPRELVWNALAGCGFCLLGAVLAAAQLLPTLELAPLSIRGAGVNWSDAVAGSLPSYLAVRALLPPYWLYVPYTEYLGYVGVVPVVLGLVALATARGRPVIFGVLLCFLGVFFALGENNPLYAWFFYTVPGFDTFRVPARWLLAWEFGAALMASLGADWISRGSQLSLRRVSFWARAGLVLLIVVAGVWWQRESGEPFPQRRTPLLFLALGLATLALCAWPRFGRPILAVAALVAITAGELWAVSADSPARLAPPPSFTVGETTQWLQEMGVTDSERLLSMARPEYVPAIEDSVRMQLSGMRPELIDSVLIAQKWRDTLTPNIPLEFGLNTADGYDGGVLPLLRWFQLSGVLVDNPRSDGVLLTRLNSVPDDRVLDLLGVRYVIANAETDVRADMQTVDFNDLLLFARPDAVPRSLVVFGWSSAPDDDAALARLAAADFDSNREVVVSGAVAAPNGGAAAPLTVTPDIQQPEKWHAHVSLTQPGYLLQREAWYPGWRVRVDGLDTPMLRADLLFRAVPLPEGEHDVTIYFDSASFDRGALLSLLGLLVVLAVLAWPLLAPHLRRRSYV